MLSQTDIDTVIGQILEREGGFVDDPADRGGRTNFGITQATADAWGLGDVANLDRAAAIAFYRAWFTHYRIDRIPDVPVFALVADSAVLHGPARAVLWLQAALGVTADGSIGPQTTAAMQARSWPELYAAILAQRINFYGALVHNDASQAKFIHGWLSRATEFLSPWPY